MPYMRYELRQASDEIAARARMAPRRPVSMCEEQRADYLAACAGKITWRQYFAKWGNAQLAL